MQPNKETKMKPMWILERNVFAEKCFDEMVDHFIANGIPYDLVRIIPFIHEIEGNVPEVKGRPCIVYGSIGSQKLAIDHGWSPGVWIGPGLDEKKLIQHLGEFALNADAKFCSMTEVITEVGPDMNDNPKWPFEKFFIKPNTDTKEFAGQTIGLMEFGPWYENMCAIGYLTNNDFEVMISKPKRLGCEWRLVLCEGKVIGSSIYKQYGKVMSNEEWPEKVIHFAETMAAMYSPYDVFVMDIVDVGYDKYKVIEYNTFNSAGLYSIDVGKVIDKINEFVMRKHA